MAKALRHLPGGRPVALLLGGLAASSLGDWMYNVALLALVYDRTGSPTWVAVTTAARILPLTVLGPFGGVLADRMDRQWLMIAGDVLRAALMLGLTAVAVLGLPIVLVPALAGLATGAGVAHQTCVATAIARFVDESELGRVSALRAGIGQGSIVAGPALGALLLALSTPAAVILANASTFLFSAAAVSAIAAGPQFRPGRTGEAAPSVLSDIRVGAAALRGAPIALRMLGADLVCSTVYGFLTVALVLVSMRAGAGTDGYGVLLGAFGVGGIVGAAVSGRRSAAARWRRTLAIALTLVALPIAALGLATSAPAAIALALVAGGGMVVAEVLTETALPQMVPDEVLARAYGLVVPASVTGIVAGSLLAAPVVALAGLGGTLAGVGALVAVMAALLLRRPRRAAMPRVVLAESMA